MPQTTQSNTTLAAPFKPKTLEELRTIFWGNPYGNQLLYMSK